ncbi:PspA/IM30 family protein [Parasphingopyxis sp. CP4]|uniref:PspA/IM30 family protein n=1 Tax=Parasphingopyxis sp. CP4 TaxID=2724527 RepID=UPI0021040B5B|nr:PspA/IM30 family protein [Parasphingopyxis sp. CP4]
MATRLDLAPVDTGSSSRMDYALPAISSRSARLFSRMRDIMAANLGEMLDRSPEPEQMIRMIICEMEETLVHARASTAKLIADHKEMLRAQDGLAKIAEDWHEKALLAISRDRDDLARQALVEKGKADARATEIAMETATLGKSIDANHADIHRLQSKLSEACRKRSNIRARLESAENSIRLRELVNGGAMQDAFARFDALERTVDEAEGHAEAAALGIEPEPRFEDDPVVAARIDAELDELRKTNGRPAA